VARRRAAAAACVAARRTRHLAGHAADHHAGARAGLTEGHAHLDVAGAGERHRAGLRAGVGLGAALGHALVTADLVGHLAVLGAVGADLLRAGHAVPHLVAPGHRALLADLARDPLLDGLGAAGVAAAVPVAVLPHGHLAALPVAHRTPPGLVLGHLLVAADLLAGRARLDAGDPDADVAVLGAHLRDALVAGDRARLGHRDALTAVGRVGLLLTHRLVTGARVGVRL